MATQPPELKLNIIILKYRCVRQYSGMLSLPHLFLKLLLITMPSRMTHRAETKYNVTTECAFPLPFTSNTYATLTIHPYSPALTSPFSSRKR